MKIWDKKVWQKCFPASVLFVASIKALKEIFARNIEMHKPALKDWFDNSNRNKNINIMYMILQYNGYYSM